MTVGPPGPDIDDVQLVGVNTYQFYAEGEPVGDPLIIPATVATGLIDGGTP